VETNENCAAAAAVGFHKNKANSSSLLFDFSPLSRLPIGFSSTRKCRHGKEKQSKKILLEKQEALKTAKLAHEIIIKESVN